MKVYVQSHQVDQSRPSDSDWRDFVVSYCATPDWTTPSRHEAELLVTDLLRERIRVGEHFCDFAVEALEDGEFAVVCLSHPDALALRPPLPRQRF